MEGVAISQDGTIGAGMGTATGDYNQDGHFDIFVTNLSQMATSGISRQPTPRINMPCCRRCIAMRPAKNLEMSRLRVGIISGTNWVGRATASGDLDNDGDTDLIVTHLQEPPAILQNESTRQGNSATLRLVGRQAARQPPGIRVDVSIADRQFATQVPAGGSFQSSHDQRILVATGTASTLSRVTVHWSPDLIETWNELPVGTESILIQGRISRGAVTSVTPHITETDRN